ncbi:unnamed protein product [Symbiodinium necroappetens]|uniref:Uncharacterized protein n=1 Tax=Symbiodinium necroappetens TaxID=1628268 RepID=A0A813AAU8_9DINO|nr:unnamed protein product [Symbiodinium necroappetens]
MKKREVQHTVRAPPKPRSAQSARPKLQHGASSKLLTVGRDIGLIRSCYRRARAFYAERRDDIHDHDTTLQKAVWSMVVAMREVMKERRRIAGLLIAGAATEQLQQRLMEVMVERAIEHSEMIEAQSMAETMCQELGKLSTARFMSGFAFLRSILFERDLEEVEPGMVLQTLREKVKSSEKDRHQRRQNVVANLFGILSLIHGSDLKALWEEYLLTAPAVESEEDGELLDKHHKDKMFANFWSKPVRRDSNSVVHHEDVRSDVESLDGALDVRRTSTAREMMKDYKFFDSESAGSASESQFDPEPQERRPQAHTQEKELVLKQEMQEDPESVMEMVEHFEGHEDHERQFSAIWEPPATRLAQEPELGLGPLGEDEGHSEGYAKVQEAQASSRTLRFREMNASLLQASSPPRPGRLSITTLLKRSMFTSLSRCFPSSPRQKEEMPEAPVAAKPPLPRPQLPRPALPMLPSTPSASGSDPPSPPSVVLGVSPDFSWRERQAGMEDSAIEKFESFSTDASGDRRPFESIALPLMQSKGSPAASRSEPGPMSEAAAEAGLAVSLLQQFHARTREAAESPSNARGEARFLVTPESTEEDSWDFGQLSESFGPRPTTERDREAQAASRDVAISGTCISHQKPSQPSAPRPLTADGKKQRVLLPVGALARNKAPPTAPLPDSPLSRKIAERRIKAAQTSAQQNDPTLSPIMAETLKQTLRKALARQAF